jgi:hypothetical protein
MHIDNIADEDDYKDMIDEVLHDIINVLLVAFDEVDEVQGLNEVVMFLIQIVSLPSEDDDYE